MTILLTGGAGKTSRRIAAELRALSPSTPVLTSSRSAPEISSSSSSSSSSQQPVVRFDWFDSTTYANALTHPAVAGPGGSPLTAVYIVLPPSMNPLPEVQAFLRVVLEPCLSSSSSSTTMTLVLLSSDTLEADAAGPAPHSRVHAYLASLGAAYPGRVRWAVLRPSFFMENFSEARHRATIAGAGAGQGEGAGAGAGMGVQQPTIYSATGDGRESFISATDIAAVGARCLLGSGTDGIELDRDYIINGPEHLSYADVARAVGHAAGRSVTHTDLTTRQLAEQHAAAGLPAEYAAILAGLDERIRNGAGRPPNGEVERITGRPGTTFAEFAEQNKAAWQ